MPSGERGHHVAKDSSTLVNGDAHWCIVPISRGEQGHHLVPYEPMPEGSGQEGHLASDGRYHSGERGQQRRDERCMSLLARAVQKHSQHGSTGTSGAHAQRENLISRINSMTYANSPLDFDTGKGGHLHEQ